MSRENFFVKLKGKTADITVYAHLDNIAYVEEVVTKDKDGSVSAPVTTIHFTNGTKVSVQEPMPEIMAKAAQYGVAKVVGA